MKNYVLREKNNLIHGTTVRVDRKIATCLLDYFRGECVSRNSLDNIQGKMY